jgi:hypothetical protein
LTIRRKGFSTDLLTETTQIWGIGVPMLLVLQVAWELLFFQLCYLPLILAQKHSTLPNVNTCIAESRPGAPASNLSMRGCHGARYGWHVVACQWIPWRGRSASCQDIPGLAGLRAVATGARLIDDSKWTTRQPAPITSRGMERNRI